MGEIGISRKEFLYDIRFWEARRIIRGYRKRGKIFMQLLAENVYASTFAFRGSEGKTVKDLFPSIFEDEEYDDDQELTEDEIYVLQSEGAALNAMLNESSEE